MHLNFLTQLSARVVATAAAAGQTLITSELVDLQGFDSVAFLVQTGDVADGAVLTLTGQTGEADDGSDAADLADPVTFTAGAADADDGLLILDLHKPRQRYVRVTLARGTANAAVSGITAILYNAHHVPVDLDATVIAGALVNDPAPA